MDFGRIDYASRTTPAGYHCHVCGRHGCKLWREYQTFADITELACCDCAAKRERKDVGDIDADGRRSVEHGQRTDQIGWRIPAVPTEDGTTFWGYSSVPDAGCEWWRRLPTRVGGKV